MSQFDKKLKEFESKSKKSNIGIITMIIVGLIIFAGLYLYNIQVQNEKRDRELLLQSNSEQLEKLEKRDSINYEKKEQREDSIQKAWKTLKAEIDRIKEVAGSNNDVIYRIDSLQTKVKNVITIAIVDTIVVRYYKRKSDGNTITNIVNSIESPNYKLNYKDVYDDDGTKTVNTLYYGKSVKKEYVDILYNKLIDNGIKIENIKSLKSVRGFEWKKNAIEIGFERPTSKTDENSEITVRLYCYKPRGDVKKKIKNQLEAKGYQVKVFPDWSEKPSFFSDEMTVLYYDSSKKEKAGEIAKILTKLTRLKFGTKMGAGLGVTKSEKKSVFIIHYNGS